MNSICPGSGDWNPCNVHPTLGQRRLNNLNIYIMHCIQHISKWTSWYLCKFGLIFRLREFRLEISHPYERRRSSMFSQFPLSNGYDLFKLRSCATKCFFGRCASLWSTYTRTPHNVYTIVCYLSQTSASVKCVFHVDCVHIYSASTTTSTTTTIIIIIMMRQTILPIHLTWFTASILIWLAYGWLSSCNAVSFVQFKSIAE